MKKLLSMLLALAMVISMVPSVFATEAEGGATVDGGVSGGTDVGLWVDAEITDLYAMDTTLAAGDSDGYIYSWVAEADGNVSFTGMVLNEDGEIVDAAFEIVVYHGDEVVYLSESEDNTAAVDVSAGDKVYVQVVALPDENGAYPAMTVSAWGTFTHPEGTEENPIFPEFTWNDANTEATATVIAPVGTTYYAVWGAGMLMSIDGGEAFTLVANGMGRAPAIFTIVNESEAEEEHNLKIWYPEGSMENPADLELGYNDVSLAAGDFDGYYYDWTAEADGTLTVFIASITEGVEADIVINNNTTSVNKTLLADGVDNYGLEVSMDVAAGDEIVIQAVVMPDENWEYPAADITWSSSFAYPAGSAENPINVEFTWNDEYTEATATVVAPVGTTYYQTYGAGMILTIDDGEPIVLQSMNPRMPAVFTITNDGEAEAEYNLKLVYPAGAMENPADLVIGENTASIEAGSQGYFYTWIAEADGTLSITMPAGDWTYVINNLTTGIYGDTQWSDSDPVVNPATIEVAAGDEIQIMVNTYNPADMWSNPAGDLVITAAFEEAVVEPAGPVIVTQPTNAAGVDGKSVTLTVEATSDAEIRYVWYVDKNDGAGFVYANAFDGWKTATLTVPVTAERFGWLFKCEVSNTDKTGMIYTDVVTIIEKVAALSTPTNSGNKEVVEEKTAVFAVYVNTTDGADKTTIKYAWQSSMDGENWSYLNGWNGWDTNRLTVKAWASRNNMLFRCKISDADGAYIYSNPQKLTLAANPLVITAQPQDVAAVRDTVVYFNVVLEGYVEYARYQWLYSKDGVNFAKIASCETVDPGTFAVKAYEARDGWSFYCYMYDSIGNKANSDVVKLTIKENPLKINSQPVNTTIAEGETAVFTIDAEGFVGDAKYQWYLLKPGETTWAKADGLEGHDTNSLSVYGYAVRSGWQFKCVVADSVSNKLISNVVTLTVN